MHTSLDELRKLVQLWSSIPSIDLPERAYYIWKRLPELENLNLKLEQDIDDVRGLFLSLIALAEQTQSKDIETLEKAVEAMAQKADADHQAQCKQYETMLRKQQKVLDALLANGQHANFNAAAVSNDPLRWTSVEQSALQADHSSTQPEMKRLLSDLRGELRVGLSSPSRAPTPTPPPAIPAASSKVTDSVLCVNAQQGSKLFDSPSG